ncbi:MAG: hypothetical protein H6613_13825 [Ignavibacteriales bacterium]|nr:hypothetical protein [Ignavibacteriales bacterium]
MVTKMFVPFLFVLFSFNVLSAQVIGEIFDADYANKEFGEVVSFVEVNNSELTGMLKEAGEYIMLNINTGNGRALNGERKSVTGFAESESEVFYKMSTSQVNLLLKKGGKKTTRIEMRPKTLTVTNSAFTLEMVLGCPPKCD